MPTKIATALARGSSREAAAQLCREVRARLEGRAPVLLAVFSSTRQPGFHNTTSVVLAFPEG